MTFKKYIFLMLFGSLTALATFSVIVMSSSPQEAGMMLFIGF